MSTFTRFYMGDEEDDAAHEAAYWGKPGCTVVRVCDVTAAVQAKAAERSAGRPTQRALGQQANYGTRVWLVTQRRVA